MSNPHSCVLCKVCPKSCVLRKVLSSNPEVFKENSKIGRKLLRSFTKTQIEDSLTIADSLNIPLKDVIQGFLQEIEGRKDRPKEGRMAMYYELEGTLKEDCLDLFIVQEVLGSVTKELDKLRGDIQYFNVGLAEAEANRLEAESKLYRDFTFGAGGGGGGGGIDGQGGGGIDGQGGGGVDGQGGGGGGGQGGGGIDGQGGGGIDGLGGGGIDGQGGGGGDFNIYDFDFPKGFFPEGFNAEDLVFPKGFFDRVKDDNLGLNEGLEHEDLDDGLEFGDLDFEALKVGNGGVVPGEVGDGEAGGGLVAAGVGKVVDDDDDDDDDYVKDPDYVDEARNDGHSRVRGLGHPPRRGRRGGRGRNSD